jgi:hypothetical protein
MCVAHIKMTFTAYMKFLIDSHLLLKRIRRPRLDGEK